MPVAPASGFASPATGPATGPDPAALPGDWQKLGFDGDPLPGNPRVLQQIVEDFTFLRDTAWAVHQGLNAFLATAGPDTFQGQTAEALREVVSGRLKTFIFNIARAFSLAGEAVAEYQLALKPAQQAVSSLVAQAAGLAAGDRKLAGLTQQVTEQVAQVQVAEALMIRTLQDASAMVSQPIAVPSLFAKIWKGVEEALSIAGMVLALLSVVVDGPLGVMAAAAAGASLAMTAVDYARGKTNALGVVLAVVGLLAPTTKGMFTLEEAGAGLRGFLGTLGQAGAKTGSALSSPAHLAALVARTGSGAWQALTRAPGLLAQAVRAAPGIIPTIVSGVLTRAPQALGGLGEALGRDFATVHKWYPQLSRMLSPHGAYALVSLGRFGGALLTPMTVQDLAALGFRGAWRAGLQRASWANAARALHRGWTSYGIRAAHAAFDVGQMLHLLGGLRPQPDTGHLPTLLLPGPVRWTHRGPDDLAEPLLTPVTPWTAHDPAHTTPPSVPTTRTALDIAEYNGRAGLLTTRSGLLVPATSLLNDHGTWLLHPFPSTERTVTTTAVTTRADPMRQTAPRPHTHLVDPNDPATTGQVQEVYATEATEPAPEAWWSPQDLPLSPWHTTWHTTPPTVFDTEWTPQADDAAQHFPHIAGPTGAPDATPHATPPPSYARERPALDPGEARPAKQARWAPTQTSDQLGPSSMPELSTVPGHSDPSPLTHTQSTLANTPGPSDPLHHLPPDWLENLHHDLVRRNHHSGLGRLVNALRTLIQTQYLKPGTYLPGRDLAQQLSKPEIVPETVRNTYAQLRNEGLLIAKRGRGTRVTGLAESPAPGLPDGWLERLQREMEGGRWIEQVLRTHVLSLQPHTPLPPHEKLAELLDLPGISHSLLRNAYGRLIEDHLLVRGSHNDMRVADHGGPMLPAPAPRASQTAGATRPKTNDSHPLLPINWVQDLRSELENNPRSNDTKAGWFAQVLRTRIPTLPPRTHLPSHRDLEEKLKNVGITREIASRAYDQLKAEGLLISGGNQGTWVASPEDLVRHAAKRQASPELPDDWVKTLRHELENNPPSHREKTAWFTRALERNIQSLTYRTRLPSYQYLAKQLKSTGVNDSLAQKAYAHLRETGQLTTEFGKGTWVVQTRNAVDPATEPGLPQARMEYGEPPLPADPFSGTLELDEAQFREMWEFWDALDDEDYESGSGAGAGHLDGLEPMDSSAYPGLSSNQFTAAEHAPGPGSETHFADPNSPAATGQVQEVYATGPDAEAGRSLQDFLLSPGHTTPPTVLDDAGRTPQADGAAQHLPHAAVPIGAPDAESHTTLPPNWLKNLHLDLVCSNHHTERDRLVNALRVLIQTEYLKPGTYLSGREVARQLLQLQIGEKIVRHAYAQLCHEGLLIIERGCGTWVAGLAEFPAPVLPDGWRERLQREMEDGRWVEQVLRTHILRLQPHTSLPPHGELAELLGIPEISYTLVENAYGQLTEDGLLVRGSHNNPQVADHGDPVHPATAPRASQTAEATRPKTNDSHPLLPINWVRDLRSELKTNPRLGREKTAWFTRALERNIQSLTYRTRLPSYQYLAKQLKSTGVNDSIVQKVYAHLRETGQLTPEFGKGTWVVQNRNVMDSTTRPELPQIRMEHGEPPLPTDPLPDFLELNEAQLREVWDVLDGEDYGSGSGAGTGHLDGLADAPSVEPHVMPPPSYARERPALDLGEPRPVEQARWAPAQTADQFGPSSRPGHPAPWPLTHTQPALADTPGPSDPLQHHLPPNWLKNLHRDLVGKNHRAKSGRLTNALRALIQTTCLKPGTYLSGREAIRQLARLKIHPGTVWKAYAQLGDEGLLITKRTGTWVAGPAESPASARPAEWLEQLQREMEDDRWFEQVLRTHILRLQPHTPLPPHGELAELLEIPEISETFVLNAYDRLTEDGLLVRNSHNNPQVADHGGPVHPAMGWQASQTAGTVLPDAGDPEPELPDDWIKTLQRELENNPPPHREKITCLTRALERHIQNLKYQTRLPSNRDLAKQLKSAWINYSIVQKAYAHLKKTGQLTSEFGNGQGTWVAQPRNVMDSATGPGLPQARREHSEPPLPPDPFLDIPEPDETYPWEFREIWDVLDGKEPRPTPPVVPGAELDPQTERAAQATGHLTDLSYLPSPDVHPDVCDILNLLNPDGSITAMHPDLWHLP